MLQGQLETGYTSVMIDASTQSFEDNISITKQIVELAHNVDVSVEAELGTIEIMVLVKVELMKLYTTIPIRQNILLKKPTLTH